MKSWLKNKDIEMHSMQNEGKSVVAERFIRTIKNKVYKYTSSVPKNVSINNLADTVDIYNNTYDSTIKMKPTDVKSNIYIDFNKKKTNRDDPKLEVGDHVKISQYKYFCERLHTKLV